MINEVCSNCGKEEDDPEIYYEECYDGEGNVAILPLYYCSGCGHSLRED